MKKLCSDFLNIFPPDIGGQVQLAVGLGDVP